MGANDCLYSTSETNKDKIVKKHDELVQESLFEDGHSYSGCIGMFGYGIDFLSKEFKNREEAEDFILDKHSKWDNAMAVRYKSKSGKINWLIGGWVSS
ncbi:hypothetical protein ACFL4H_00240 [Candidatus Neomarinimicrobiota bacterium]